MITPTDCIPLWCSIEWANTTSLETTFLKVTTCPTSLKVMEWPEVRSALSLRGWGEVVGWLGGWWRGGATGNWLAPRL